MYETRENDRHVSYLKPYPTLKNLLLVCRERKIETGRANVLNCTIEWTGLAENQKTIAQD